MTTLHHLLIAMPPGREAEARAFYGALIGLAEIAKPADLQARGGVWFQIGTQQLHLGVERDFQPARKAHPAFLVRDLESLQVSLAAAGHPIGSDFAIDGYRRLFTADPFGNRIELLQATG